jgi:ABC-type Mn2+/Zn2+ transport system permease subunit
MTEALFYAYLGGCILTFIGVSLAARRLQDEHEPAAHTALVSVVAGAVWPVLVIALAEAAFVALTQEYMQQGDEPLLSLVA